MPTFPTRPQGIRYPVGQKSLPLIEIEVFLDFNCPFSRKIFNRVMEVSSSNNIEGVQLVFQLVPQPWHPQSSILHEFGLAVRALFGDAAFFQYASTIFGDAQLTVFDDQTFTKSRKDIYEHLVKTCESFIDSEGALKIMDFLSIKPDSSNSGNSATNLLKLCVKYHRVRGVHVTPTVFINGIEAPDISSGWTSEQWHEKLSTV